jgi:hypothetical protein
MCAPSFKNLLDEALKDTETSKQIIYVPCWVMDRVSELLNSN